jgi:hypothetical protein
VHTEALHSKRPGTQLMHLSENREVSKGLIWVSCSNTSEEHFTPEVLLLLVLSIMPWGCSLCALTHWPATEISKEAKEVLETTVWMINGAMRSWGWTSSSLHCVNLLNAQCLQEWHSCGLNYRSRFMYHSIGLH